MNDPRHEHQLVALYEQHFDRLVGIAIERFKIATAEAETLVHDVFVSFLRSADRVVDEERWLVGAVCNARRAESFESLLYH
ncbi:MAG: hypothetical protein ACLGH0_02810 [Thermoanaerobaculia bacterium]